MTRLVNNKTVARTFAFLTFLMVLPVFSSAQTVGIGEVLSIESKSAQFVRNSNKIEELKLELPELELQLKKKIDLINREIALLIKERDALIADMKVGARCSQCGGWKSDFEKRGENFEKHLGDVKGYAVPASTSELEKTRKEYAEKIAIKRVQAKKLEKGDGAILKKKEEIKLLDQRNEEICKEITAHSKTYETKVFADAKAKHEDWIGQLASAAIDVLIATDKIEICRAQILRYEQEFSDESVKVNEGVKKKHEDQQRKMKAEVLANEQLIKEANQALVDYLSPLEKQLGEVRKEKSIVESNLKVSGISDSAKDILTGQLKDLSQRILSLENNIRDHKEAIGKKVSGLENANKVLADKIHHSKASLSSEQAKAVNELKVVYDKKIADKRKIEGQTTEVLSVAKSRYSKKEAELISSNTDLHNEIGSESNRMLIAGQGIRCSIWNNTGGMVMNNWNSLLPCVQSLYSKAKTYSSGVFNSYCGNPSYLSKYKNFLASLNSDEREAVKSITNSDLFERLTQ